MGKGQEWLKSGLDMTRKAETRRPKSESNPKAEIRTKCSGLESGLQPARGHYAVWGEDISAKAKKSDRSDLGLRISGFRSRRYRFPSVSIVGSTCPLGRNHRGPERMLGRAASPE